MIKLEKKIALQCECGSEERKRGRRKKIQDEERFFSSTLSNMSNDAQTNVPSSTGLESSLSNMSVQGSAPAPMKSESASGAGAPRKRYVPPHMRHQQGAGSGPGARGSMGGSRGPPALPPAFSGGRRGFGGSDSSGAGGGGGGRWSSLSGGGGWNDRGSRRNDGFGSWRDNKHIIGPVNERLERELFGVPDDGCLLYTSPSPRDVEESRMPSSA